MKKQINNLCAYLGKDKLLVQGSGGNVSWKVKNDFFIKASGMKLRDVNKKNIFIKLDLKRVLLNLKKNKFNLKIEDLRNHKNKLRPSIETAFHAIIPSKIIIHLHAVNIITYLVRKNAKKEINEIIGDKINWRFVKYCKPGAELAREIDKVKRKDNDIDAFFLANHGIILTGNTISEIKEKLKIIDLFKNDTDNLNRYKKKIDKNKIILEKNIELIPIKPNKIQYLALCPNLYRYIQFYWALFPDHVVFLGSRAIIFKSKKELKKKIKNYKDFSGKPIFIKNKGVYSIGKIKKSYTEQLLCYFDVINRLPKNTSLSPLKEIEIKQLINWEAEKFRINMLKNY